MAYAIDTFLNDYRTLEGWARTHYDVERMEDLEKNDFGSKINSELKYFRYVRNIVTHNPCGTETPLIQLTDEFGEQFKNLCTSLMEPKTVMDIAILGTKIYKRELSDLVMPTIRHMHEKVYTHVPIMMNNKVWGVFSENTLFELANDDKLYAVDSKLQFCNLDYCRIKKSKDSVYGFISRDKTLQDVNKIFKEAVDAGRRIDILFITDTGNSDGRMIGLITAWDMAAL